MGADCDLLLHFDRPGVAAEVGSVFDSSTRAQENDNHTVTQIATPKKWGCGSLDCGSSIVHYRNGFYGNPWGGKSFCYESFLKWASDMVEGNLYYWWHSYNDVTSSRWAKQYFYTVGGIYYFNATWFDNAVGTSFSQSFTLPSNPNDGNFHHFAMIRDKSTSNRVGVFYDGNILSPGWIGETLNIWTGSQLTIGTDKSFVSNFPGYIDEFRATPALRLVTAGEYPDTCTVPTLPYEPSDSECSQSPSPDPPAGYCEYVEVGQVRKMFDSVSGLDHLEGENVEVQVDGGLPVDEDEELVTNSFLVSSGTITLPRKVAVVHAGLPYDGKIQLLRSSQGSADDSGQMKMRRVYLATIQFFQSLGLKIGLNEDNLDPVFSRIPVVPLQTGAFSKLPKTDWKKDSEIILKMEDPLPCFILNLVSRSELEEKG